MSAAVLCNMWWKKSKILIVFVLTIFIALSISRTSSMMINYNAPIAVYTNFYLLSKNETNTRNVCVGKEWYR
jgi:hypothetical protein